MSRQGKPNLRIIAELFIFCILAFIIRLFLLDINEQSSMDSMSYLMAGYNFIRGNFSEGISFYWPMLYPIFAGIFSIFIKDIVFAGCLTSIFFSSISIIPAYFLSYSIFNRQIACLTCILLISYPLLITAACTAMTDSMYIFLFMMAIWTGWKAINNKKLGYYTLTGFLIGLCYLTRATGLTLFILMSILMSVVIIRQHSGYRKITALIIGFLILALPYIIFERIYAGEWAMSINAKWCLAHARVRMTSGKTVEWRWTSGLNEAQDSTRADDFLYAVGRSHKSLKLDIPEVPLSRQIIYTMKHIYQFYIDLLPSIFPPIIIILASVGFAKPIADTLKLPGSYLYLLYFAILPVVQSFYFFLTERYFLPMVPPILIFAGAGLYHIHRVLRFKLLNFAFTFIVIISLFLNLPSLRIKLKDIKNKSTRPPPSYVAAGKWIKTNYPVPQKIMAVSSLVALYANTNRFVVLPAYCTYEEMLNYARLKNVFLIVINERDIMRFDRYRQKFLLDPKNTPEELKLVYQYNADPQWGRILIYEIRRKE